MRILKTLLLVAFLQGCASYDGRGLVPGSSTGADVERMMGQPKEKLAAADGIVREVVRIRDPSQDFPGGYK